MKKRLTLTVNQEVAKNLVKAKTDCLVVGVNAGSTMNEVASVSYTHLTLPTTG